MLRAMESTAPFETVPARILGQAASRLGGERLLAEALDASPMQVACWLSGLHQPPRPVVVRALGIVLKHLADPARTAKPTGAP
jgi:hypothetical protein